MRDPSPTRALAPWEHCLRHHRKSRRAGHDFVVAPVAGETLDSTDRDSLFKDKRRHKDLQLCRQAFRALSLALAGGCGDEALAALVVRAVLPSPDATRLLVCLEPGPAMADAGHELDLPDVLDRLERARPALRREVTEALVRKRAPELEFVVMPRREVQP